MRTNRRWLVYWVLLAVCVVFVAVEWFRDGGWLMVVVGIVFSALALAGLLSLQAWVQRGEPS